MPHTQNFILKNIAGFILCISQKLCIASTVSITDDYVSILGFPHSSDGKESVCNAGDLGSIPELGRFPGETEWQPTPVFWPGKSHGQSSLEGYSPWSCKESDMTE